MKNLKHLLKILAIVVLLVLSFENLAAPMFIMFWFGAAVGALFSLGD